MKQQHIFSNKRKLIIVLVIFIAFLMFYYYNGEKSEIILKDHQYSILGIGVLPVGRSVPISDDELLSVNEYLQ